MQRRRSTFPMVTTSASRLRAGLGHRRRSAAGGLVLALVAALALSAPAPAASPPAAPSVAPGPGIASVLEDVSSVSTADVWAVGRYYSTSGLEKTLIQHWDGTRWAKVRSLNPVQSRGATLVGVSAVTANDAWAVGGYYDGSHKTLIEHWDGTRWRIVASPTPDCYCGLSGVTAISASDVWAVGADASDYPQPMIFHWDGTSWTRVAHPTFNGALNGVSATSAADAWAVGWYFEDRVKTLIEHWDGTGWTKVRSPTGKSDNELSAVSARSASDVWAVGNHRMREVATLDIPRLHKTLIEHWDGKRWTVVPSPNLPPWRHNRLMGVSAISAKDAWAVGYASAANLAKSRTLIEHWDGTSWTIVPGPDLGCNCGLHAVSVSSSEDAWAVGRYDVATRDRALVDHWDGKTWTHH